MIAQLGLLAQGSDFDNWTNLLILLVMGALWLVGALVKTASRGRSAQQDGRGGLSGRPSRPRETWQERLARKVEEIQRAAEAGSTETARRTEQKTGLPAGGGQTPPARAPGGKITVRQGPGGESVMVYERPATQPPAPPAPPAPRPTRRRRIPQPVEATVRAPAPEPALTRARIKSDSSAKPTITGLPSAVLEPSAPDTARIKAPQTPADLEAPPVLDYGDPDALRKAILHYEILGKPLAFRDLFE
jgi:hypothetical protein